MAGAAGVSQLLEVDSAGVADYHVGQAPDRRSQAHARRRGYELASLRAREVAPADFHQFDWLLAMDRGHLRELQDMAPPGATARLGLFLDFAPAHTGRDVPDPYYGGADGFERVLDLVEAGCEGLLHTLLKPPTGPR